MGVQEHLVLEKGGELMSKMLSLAKQQYVNRVEQIDEVKRRLNTIRLGQTVFDSILEWYGIPGIGKTTLAQNAIAEYCHRMEVPFACLDFNPEENENAGKYSADPILLLEDIFKGIGVYKPTDFLKTLERYRQATDEHLRAEREKRVLDEFLHYVNELLKDDPVALLFDTTDKAAPETVTWLEESVISPLCRTGKCIIVWTGRFPQRWKRFEVRRRVASSKLDPLLPEATAEQVGPTKVKIYQFTFGHPMANERVAEAIERFEAEGQPFQEEDLVNELVDKVIDKYVMEGVPLELNAACRVLAVVRQFDVIVLRRILSKFVDYFREMKDTLFLGLVGRLSETHLVEWDAVRKGYALDETLRRILALHLRLNQPEQYLQVNKVAADIYDEWIERVRENRSVYVLERLYHQANIASAEGKSSARIASKLERELENYLERYYQDKDQEFAYSSTTRLYQELRKDDELRKLVGGKGFAQLQKTIEQHRSALMGNA